MPAALSAYTFGVSKSSNKYVSAEFKVLEAYYIVLKKSTLHDELEPDRLNLFRNGVT